MEKAGLAAPFDIASNGWFVTDLLIRGPGTIDPNKVLEPVLALRVNCEQKPLRSGFFNSEFSWI
jgi:hypothetical protein